MILGAGLALYAIRARFPVGYGVGELVIGSLATTNVFFPTFDDQGLNRAARLQVLAGLYVMVRASTISAKAWRVIQRGDLARLFRRTVTHRARNGALSLIPEGKRA